jgi:hypothetical protein
MLLSLSCERASNASHLPSGDQLGLPAVNPPEASEVTCRTSEPSLAQVQISDCPERVDANAMRVPSCEYRASPSNAADAMSCFGRSVEGGIGYDHTL